jgi:hypothetical protein
MRNSVSYTDCPAGELARTKSSAENRGCVTDRPYFERHRNEQPATQSALNTNLAKASNPGNDRREKRGLSRRRFRSIIIEMHRQL